MMKVKIIDISRSRNTSMLNCSQNSTRSIRLNECILRRRARNLRAKVKALLPTNVCWKHDRRNRNVQNMSETKENWAKSKSQQLMEKNCRCRWKVAQQKSEDLYYEDMPQINQEQRFEKLTEAEIQQIKEDKLYYLGQQNLRDFQSYINEKEYKAKRKQLCGKSFQIIAEAFQNCLPPKDNLLKASQRSQCWRDYDDKLRQTLSGNTKTEAFTSREALQSEASKRKWESARKFAQFEERRKMILVEEKSKVIMSKVKLNMKNERADQNLYEMKLKETERMSKRKEMTEERSRRIKTQQKNTRNRGQIKLIQEQIRKIFLSKPNMQP